MATGIVVKELVRGSRVLTLQLTNGSGAAEAAVVKVDKSALLGPLNVEPASIRIDEINWSIAGGGSVCLQWDNDAGVEDAVTITGNGYNDYITSGGLNPADTSLAATGDLLLTTIGAVTSYDLTLSLRLKGAVDNVARTF